MASEAAAGGLAVSFEPDRLDHAPPDATITVEKQGAALWRVRIDYLGQAENGRSSHSALERQPRGSLALSFKSCVRRMASQCRFRNATRK
jgi:hypothetical protein